MRKNLLALAAFSGILFTSCSNEMDQMVEQQKEQNAIGFSTYSMMSKGAPIIDNGAFAQNGSSFEVVAFLNEKTSTYLRAPIAYEGGWDYANPLDKAYWPNGVNDKLNFFAVAPYSDFNTGSNSVEYFNVQASGADPVVQENKSMKITYTVPTTTSEQQDLMYATTAPMGKPSGGNVPLEFKHALNQIHFKGKTDSKNLKVIINPSDGIQLFNLYASAVGTVAQSDQSDQSVIDWDYTGKTADQIFTNMTPAEDIVINTTSESEESVSLTNPSDVLMLLPQPIDLPVWKPTPTTPPTEAVAKTGSYLKISCKLIALGKDGLEVYLHGSEGVNGFADMYVPFNCSAMEASGKKITYTLIFGGGYDDNGNTILTPITFTAEVEGWVPANS